MPTAGDKFAGHHIRRALIIAGITAATLLLSACGNTDRTTHGTTQQQEVVIPADESGAGIGTEMSAVQDQVAPGISSQSDAAEQAVTDGWAGPPDDPNLAAASGNDGATAGTTTPAQCKSSEGSTIEIVRSGVAGAASKTGDPSPDCPEGSQLSDGQKSTVTSVTAPSAAESMTSEEIQMFLDLPEVKNGIISMPTAQPKSISPTPSATPSP